MWRAASSSMAQRLWLTTSTLCPVLVSGGERGGVEGPHRGVVPGYRAWKRAELVSHADELDLLVVAAHRLLLDVAEAGDVELALGDPRVELGGRLLGEQRLWK
jgi:hypothetical protein